ncbi:protein unc-93 homolog A-like [Ylistrum balloti]|uniref:protein unc-93 homolog A-like n=1 Tax=Ylistrum balloti TaxID=509963 RepID=UPI002905C238|nr:protein unc-93 homolog A-like [Ylistrum balloti]
MDLIMKKGYAKLLVLSVGWFLFFLSFSSIRNVTSSINHEDGLGLCSMAGTYGGFMLACCITTSIVRRYTTKWVLVVSLGIQIVFVLANLSRNLYLLVPISVMCGASQAAMWTAVSTYVVDLVVQLEDRRSLEVLSRSLKARMFGIFFFFGSLAPVFGALLTSFILSYNRNEGLHISVERNITNCGSHETFTSNCSNVSSIGNVNTGEYRSTETVNTLCGPRFCHANFDEYAERAVKKETRTLLFGVYTACMAIALLGYAFLLDGSKSLKEVLCSSEVCVDFAKDTKSVFKLFAECNFLLISPLILFHGVQTAFFSGEITKAFAGCLYGVDMVGYFVAVYGTSAALTAFTTGFASKIVNRTFLLSTAAVVDLFALVAMLIWSAENGDMLYVFSLAFLWGIGEGIWTTHLNSLVGVLYANKPEAAFSAYNLVLSFGLTVGYIYSNYVCMDSKIYVTGCLCIIGMFSYAIFTRKKPSYQTREETIIVQVTANTDVLETEQLNTDSSQTEE